MCRMVRVSSRICDLVSHLPGRPTVRKSNGNDKAQYRVMFERVRVLTETPALPKKKTVLPPSSCNGHTHIILLPQREPMRPRKLTSRGRTLAYSM